MCIWLLQWYIIFYYISMIDILIKCLKACSRRKTKIPFKSSKLKILFCSVCFDFLKLFFNPYMSQTETLYVLIHSNGASTLYSIFKFTSPCLFDPPSTIWWVLNLDVETLALCAFVHRFTLIRSRQMWYMVACMIDYLLLYINDGYINKIQRACFEILEVTEIL